MPMKKTKKRPAAPKSPSAFDARQADLAAVRALRRTNQAIVAEAKSAERLMTRADIVLGRVMSRFHDRTGMIVVNGEDYARLLTRVDELMAANDELAAKVDDAVAARDRLAATGA